MSVTPDKLRECLLHLAGPDDYGPQLSEDVIDRLCELGFAYKRDDGRFDRTDQGKAVYERMAAGKPTPELE
jgi:hypothetical protein